jgi:uncharacterized protein with HEPN domain
MPRDYKVYLEDIREAITRIREYTLGQSRETFGGDRKTLDAVIRNLEVIGEAVKQLPADLRAQTTWCHVAEGRWPPRPPDSSVPRH